jgi:hypothetical protein
VVAKVGAVSAAALASAAAAAAAASAVPSVSCGLRWRDEGKTWKILLLFYLI